jgi:hypothetical protein
MRNKQPTYRTLNKKTHTKVDVAEVFESLHPVILGLKLTPVKGELGVFGFGRGVEVRLTFPPRINARETKKRRKKRLLCCAP